MKKILQYALLTSISTLSISSIANAEEEKNFKPISAEIGAGLNITLPFAHIKGAYRLPVLDSKLDIYADYSFLNVPFGKTEDTQSVNNFKTQYFITGFNYYFNKERTMFSPYVGVGLASIFNLPDAKESFNFGGFGGIANIGTDVMFNECWGMSGAINLFFASGGVAPRIELNVKHVF
jgi:hypothetical protein